MIIIRGEAMKNLAIMKIAMDSCPILSGSCVCELFTPMAKLVETPLFTFAVCLVRCWLWWSNAAMILEAIIRFGLFARIDRALWNQWVHKSIINGPASQLGQVLGQD